MGWGGRGGKRGDMWDRRGGGWMLNGEGGKESRGEGEGERMEREREEGRGKRVREGEGRDIVLGSNNKVM